MSMNVSVFDRLLRLALGLLLAYFAFAVYGGTALGISLAIGSIILTLTAIVGVCPLYGLLGIRTRQSY